MKVLLPQLRAPLHVTRQQVLYVKPKESDPFRIGRFPVFIFKGEGDADAYYGMPEFQGLGVKSHGMTAPTLTPTT